MMKVTYPSTNKSINSKSIIPENQTGYFIGLLKIFLNSINHQTLKFRVTMIMKAKETFQLRSIVTTYDKTTEKRLLKKKSDLIFTIINLFAISSTSIWEFFRQINSNSNSIEKNQHISIHRTSN